VARIVYVLLQRCAVRGALLADALCGCSAAGRRTFALVAARGRTLPELSAAGLGARAAMRASPVSLPVRKRRRVAKFFVASVL